MRIPNFFLIVSEASSLENHREFEVSKYIVFSKCGTHGYYMLRKYCIFKPRIRGSLRDLKFPRQSGRSSQEFAIRCPRDSMLRKRIFFRALMLLRDARPRRNTQHSLLTSFVINVAKVARYQRRQRYNSRNALPRSLLLAPCWGSNRPIEVLHNSALIRPLEELLEMQYVSRRTRFFYSRSPQSLLSGRF